MRTHFRFIIFMVLVTSSNSWLACAEKPASTLSHRDVQKSNALAQLDERIGTLYANKEFKAALPLLKQYIRMLERSSSDPHSLHMAYSKIAELFLLLRKPSESQTYWYKADRLERKCIGSEDLHASELGVIGIKFIGNSQNPEIDIVYEDSPAQRAGLLKGDNILAVDGVTTRHTSGEHLFHMLTGKPGTSVTVLIRRESSEFTVQMTRRKVDEIGNESFKNSFPHQ
jgi:C-terminal processing protease CtpA/Prc